MNTIRGFLPHGLVSVFCIMLLLCGCQNTVLPSAATAQTQAAPVISETLSPSIIKETTDQFQEICRDIFENQVTESYLDLHFTLHDPSAFGIHDYPITFGSLSLDSIKQKLEKEKSYVRRLSALNSSALSEEDQLTLEVLLDVLNRDLELDGLELYYQPLAPTTGIQAQLPILLSEMEFDSEKDVQDYLTLLSSFDTYYQEILSFEKEKAAAGLFLTDTCVDTIAEDCQAYLLAPEHHLLGKTFTERLDNIEELKEEDKNTYITQNLQMIEEHVIPGYTLLINGLKELKGSSHALGGLSTLPKGEEYFAYLVSTQTGTSFTSVKELHEKIEAQVNADLTAMSRLMKAHPDVIDQFSSYHFAITDPKEILLSLKKNMHGVFPDVNLPEYTIKYIPSVLESSLSPAFFMIPQIDDSEHCTIYLNQNHSEEDQTLYSLLAHEGYPGHMYQTLYFHQKNLSPIRLVLNIPGYSEGWGTYSEYYAYTKENGLSEELNDLLRLNSASVLGLHALLSIEINANGWTRKQTADYLSEYYGIKDDDVAASFYDTLVNSPVNYLSYYVGYLEFLQMRQMAEDKLGNQFSEEEFHRFLLDLGPAPFSVLQKHLKSYLLTYSITN